MQQNQTFLNLLHQSELEGKAEDVIEAYKDFYRDAAFTHYTDKPLAEDPERASEAMRRLVEGTDEYDAVTPKGRTVDELVADYQAKAKKFGTIALAVNNGDDARKAYMKYKSRDSVEKIYYLSCSLEQGEEGLLRLRTCDRLRKRCRNAAPEGSSTRS